jgi:hypothetical protein
MGERSSRVDGHVRDAEVGDLAGLGGDRLDGGTLEAGAPEPLLDDAVERIAAIERTMGLVPSALTAPPPPAS